MNLSMSLFPGCGALSQRDFDNLAGGRREIRVDGGVALDVWWEFALAVVALAAILLSLGGLIGWSLGLRGLWLYALAPLIALPVIGGAAVVAPMARIPWSLLPVLVVAAIVAAVVWLLRRRFGEAMAATRATWRVPVALAIPGVIIAGQVITVIGAPENLSNTFDNVFHLNVVRYILDTANASSLAVGHLTDHSGTAAFYPAAWHDVVSLVAQVTGVDTRIAVNSMSFVVSVVIWPAGVVLLTRQLFGTNRVVLLAAGILAAAFPLFPLLLMDYGVLYPYQLAVALLPALLATTLRAVAVGRRLPAMRPWQAWVLLVGIIPGVLLAHPGAFVAWMAFTVPVAVLLFVRGLARARRWGRRVGIVVAGGAYLLAGYALLMILRPSSGRDWPIEMRMRTAASEVLIGSVWYGVPTVLGVTAVLVGIVWAVIRRRSVTTVVVGMLVVAAVLYIVVASVPFPHLRDALTGSWYNNRPRLAALLPIIAAPLGAYGVAATWAWLRSTSVLRQLGKAASRPVRMAVSALTVLVACVVTQLPGVSPVPAAVERASESYRTSPSARLLTDDELTLLERLDDETPADSVIVGSPWTGTALAYGIAGRQVILPHMFTTTTAQEDVLLNSLNQATPGSAVCDAVPHARMVYVLDFGSQEIHGATHIYPGLIDLSESPALQLIDSEGEAKLFQLVGC